MAGLTALHAVVVAGLLLSAAVPASAGVDAADTEYEWAIDIPAAGIRGLSIRPSHSATEVEEAIMDRLGTTGTCLMVGDVWTKGCEGAWCAQHAENRRELFPTDDGRRPSVLVRANLQPLEWRRLGPVGKEEIEKALRQAMYANSTTVDSQGSILALPRLNDDGELVSADGTPVNMGKVKIPAQGPLAKSLWMTQPRRAVNMYAAADFSLLLPTNAATIAVGESYPLRIEAQTFLLCMLSQMHDRPAPGRYSPGAIAMVRATDDDLLWITFRWHAEYVIQSQPAFYFTPSFFLGQMVINRNGTDLRSFHLEVPFRPLNLDLEWFGKGPNVMDAMGHVDSGGYTIENLPRMEFSLSDNCISGPDTDDARQLLPSVSPAELIEHAGGWLGTEEGAAPHNYDIESASLNRVERGRGASLDDWRNWAAYPWQDSRPMLNVTTELEAAFYPFRSVHYYPHVTPAFRRARAEGKLVHVIALWGSLLDNSC